MVLLESAGEVALGAVAELGIAALFAGAIYRVWGSVIGAPRRLLVPALNTAVVIKDAKVERVLQPGRYWASSKKTVLYADMRPRPFQIQSQDMIAEDGMGVRISMTGEQKVIDPGAFVTANSDSYAAFYLEVRQALRTAVTENSSETALWSQTVITDRMRELLEPRAAQLGVELTSLDVFEAMPLGPMRRAQNVDEGLV